MTPRMPERSDFPYNINLEIVPPPEGEQPVNVLILLHGLGDHITPFTSLGKALNLPETVCIAVQGPHHMPFDLQGWYWSDDLHFDQATGEMNMDAGFVSAVNLLVANVIGNGLVRRCGYQLRDIFLWGMGQGAMSAFAAVKSLSPLKDNERALGGIISIGGVMPESALTKPTTSANTSNTNTAKEGKKLSTPVLLCAASRMSAITPAKEAALKQIFTNVEVVKWEAKVGDSMPSNKEEMMPIMTFLAGRLRSLKGVPADAVEV